MTLKIFTYKGRIYKPLGKQNFVNLDSLKRGEGGGGWGGIANQDGTESVKSCNSSA